jgi:hypothetical protein
MCTPADVNPLYGGVPDFIVPSGGDPDIGAWMIYTDADTATFRQYWALCGETLRKTANLQGAGPCSNGTDFPAGYRLRVSHDTWGQTHDTTIGCITHADDACGFSGGDVPLAPQYTLCCESE